MHFLLLSPPASFLIHSLSSQASRLNHESLLLDCHPRRKQHQLSPVRRQCLRQNHLYTTSTLPQVSSSIAIPNLALLDRSSSLPDSTSSTPLQSKLPYQSLKPPGRSLLAAASFLQQAPPLFPLRFSVFGIYFSDFALSIAHNNLPYQQEAYRT
ncbi:hypothetical protein KSP40_PGU002536 [Platanthera guangdongensis]|uniref:Uncharacterized protein n=1 Tax=Platanthera guangdongensis TaxID=2320717 RepID=A0ABR2M257_9ASPA